MTDPLNWHDGKNVTHCVGDETYRRIRDSGQGFMPEDLPDEIQVDDDDEFLKVLLEHLVAPIDDTHYHCNRCGLDLGPRVDPCEMACFNYCEPCHNLMMNFDQEVDKPQP